MSKPTITPMVVSCVIVDDGDGTFTVELALAYLPSQAAALHVQNWVMQSLDRNREGLGKVVHVEDLTKPQTKN